MVGLLDKGQVCLIKHETKTAGVYSANDIYESMGKVGMYPGRHGRDRIAAALRLNQRQREAPRGGPPQLTSLVGVGGKDVTDATLPAFFHTLNSSWPFMKP